MKGDTMRQDYNNNQQADYMLVGFPYNGKIYMHKRRVTYFLDMFKYDKTSKKHGRVACLRFKPTAEQKRKMIADHAILWSNDEKIFFAREHQANENKGNTWERCMIETWDGTPCKNRAWWNGGDFIDNNNIIQVKYENATICTAKQCRAHRK